jgi:glucose/arabinose dehydrogenase/cytochrome c5
MRALLVWFFAGVLWTVGISGPGPAAASKTEDVAVQAAAQSPAVQPSESERASASQTKERRRYAVPPDYTGSLPSMSAVNLRTAVLDRRVENLDQPWAFEFLTDDEILVSERKGRLWRIRLDRPEERIAVQGLPEIANDRQQTGLLDVALHPEFGTNSTVFFSYSAEDAETGAYYLTAVARGQLEGDRLTDVRTVIEAGPYGWSPSNFGGALEFLADGSLLVAVGDRSEEMLAQRGDRLQGKILRLTDTGAVPPDNPFIDVSEVDDRIWAIGLRNVQGLVRDPLTNRVYATSHGPLGGDEVNRVQAGRNYGWPTVTYGRYYSTARIGVGTHAEGFEQPLFYYLPSEAISPIAIYRGEMFPDWQGDLLVGALKGKHVSRLDLDGDVVRSEYPILNEIDDRVRDIKVGPEGAVWILTQNTGLWRLRLEPEPPVPERPADGQGVYRMACAGCHDAGAGGAARLDQGCRWQELAKKGRDRLLEHTIEGFGNMPARGLCELCEDRHLAAAIDYMLDAAASCAAP